MISHDKILLISLVLMQQNNEYIIDQVKQVLVAANIDTTTEFEEFFDAASNVEPFVGLESEYLQTKYYKEKFGLLV